MNTESKHHEMEEQKNMELATSYGNASRTNSKKSPSRKSSKTKAEGIEVVDAQEIKSYKEEDKKGDDKQLIEAREIPKTPFHAIKTKMENGEDVWHVALGRYRLSVMAMKNFDECVLLTEQPDWYFIMNVMAVMIPENKPQN